MKATSKIRGAYRISTKIGAIPDEDADDEVRYWYKQGRKKCEVPDISKWKPVIIRDYSKPEEMKKIVCDLGAKAFKSKDLNYYYVDELLAASRENRPPRGQIGRFEDPNVEILEKSGEAILVKDLKAFAEEDEALTEEDRTSIVKDKKSAKENEKPAKENEKSAKENENPAEVEFRDFNAPKKDWHLGQPPMIKRKVMNFGYRDISKIKWVDCV